MAVKTVPLKKCAMRTSEVDIALERDMGFMSQLVITHSYNCHTTLFFVQLPF